LALNPNVKVLLSSGYSINGQATEILNRGCNGFIQKPFRIDAFSQKLREILDGDSTEQADTALLLGMTKLQPLR
jgi:DNA-binding NarL/FixJ family response regulator